MADPGGLAFGQAIKAKDSPTAALAPSLSSCGRKQWESMSEKDVYRNFDRGIEEIVSWSRSWLPDASAVATLVKQYNQIFGTPESPETRREHGLFWQGVRNMVDKTQELARAECGLLDEQKLALLCLGSNEINFWINKPSWKLIQGSVPGLLVMEEEEAKATLWTQHMVLQGIRRHQNPLAFLFPSHLVIWSGLYARQQFQRLEKKHPLSHSTALALLFWRNNEEIARSAAKTIARSAKRQLVVKKFPENLVPQELESLSLHVLFKDFAKYPPDEILTRALGGRFDVVPMAVALDIIDENKSEQSKFERELILESNLVREGDDDKEKGTLLENLPDLSDQSLENFEWRDSFEKFNKAHPKEAQLLKSIIHEGKSQTEIAREMDVDKSYVSRLVAKAAKTLRTFD